MNAELFLLGLRLVLYVIGLVVAIVAVGTIVDHVAGRLAGDLND